VVGLLLWGAHHTVVLNLEPSVPLGVWRLRPVPATIERGMVVKFPAPAASFPWHPWWVPFLKPVVGLPGDVVCVDAEGVWVREEWYGPVVTAAAGRPLPHLDGCQTVRVGEVFVASPNARSLDSRYYGPIKVEQVTHVAMPAWTWR
jgi:conjugative transfer signal peptidase TraF